VYTLMGWVTALAVASAHPTYYPHVDASKATFTPEILSWHVHVLYNLANNTVERALALREQTKQYFLPFMGDDPECVARQDEGRLCMINDHDFTQAVPSGPFVAGEWSIFIPLPYKNMVVEYILQRRGDFDLFIHPNSGYSYNE